MKRPLFIPSMIALLALGLTVAVGFCSPDTTYDGPITLKMIFEAILNVDLRPIWGGVVQDTKALLETVEHLAIVVAICAGLGGLIYGVSAIKQWHANRQADHASKPTQTGVGSSAR